MRLLVDGDASGHRDVILEAAREFDAEVVWVHNPSQRAPWPEEGLRLTVCRSDSAKEAADMILMNLATAGDLLVTGDVGLASVCVAKGAAALSPRGFWYRPEEMAQRLEWRALAARLRRGGVQLDHKKPAQRLDDHRFEVELREALRDAKNSGTTDDGRQ